MKYKKLFIFAISTIFVFGLLAISNSVIAQEEQGAGVTIEPALIDEKLDPGDTFTTTMKVTNRTAREQEYYFISRNIKELTEGGRPIYADIEEETPYEISSWINLPEDPLPVPAGETGEIEITINVPENASPGSHFGSIFASLQPDLPDEIATGVGYQVGTLMNIRIAGNIVEDAILREFTSDKSVYTKPRVLFNAKVQNKSNVLIRPYGPLEITNIFGKKVATLTMNEKANGIFPEQTREFEVVWEGSDLSFGRYQALLGMVYGDEVRKNVSRTVSFWVLPMNIILPVVGGLIALIGGIYVLIRWRVNKKLKMLEEAYGAKAKTQGAGIDARLSSEHTAPISRLSIIALSLLGLTLVFLIILFFLFG